MFSYHFQIKKNFKSKKLPSYFKLFKIVISSLCPINFENIAKSNVLSLQSIFIKNDN